MEPLEDLKHDVEKNVKGVQKDLNDIGKPKKQEVKKSENTNPVEPESKEPKSEEKVEAPSVPAEMETQSAAAENVAPEPEKQEE